MRERNGCSRSWNSNKRRYMKRKREKENKSIDKFDNLSAFIKVTFSLRVLVKLEIGTIHEWDE